MAYTRVISYVTIKRKTHENSFTGLSVIFFGVVIWLQ